MKRVLITGASRGIGAALVSVFATRGDLVFAAVRSSADVVTSEWANTGGVKAIVMDVSSSASVANARASIGVDAIDVVINNAGVSGGPQHAPGFDLVRVEQVFEVNAIGAIRVYDAFADLLRLGVSPWLVNISSEAGSLTHFRLSGKPEYAMSKAAMNAFTQWVSGHEAGRMGCVSIDPGWTQTDMGGSGAPRTANDTATRLMLAIDRLGAEHSGGFFDADLTRSPW
jgi:NAD(P)-dependent dehydrogenase (short-subunit alcohol dehydrogenase family)